MDNFKLPLAIWGEESFDQRGLNLRGAHPLLSRLLDLDASERIPCEFDHLRFLYSTRNISATRR